MLGGYEIWMLLAVVALVVGLPRLQRKLEQRVDEEKLGAEILAELKKRVRVEPLDEGPGVQILAPRAQPQVRHEPRILGPHRPQVDGGQLASQTEYRKLPNHSFQPQFMSFHRPLSP